MRLEIPKTTSLILGSLLAVAACTPDGPQADATASEGDLHAIRFTFDRGSTAAFHDEWRKLWEDHITWTRVVILGILHDLPGTDVYTERLLKNYEDMEEALAPYYGEEAAEELGDLLLDHLTIAAEIVTAAKAGRQGAVARLVDEWRANGDAIARQMDEMNPAYWPFKEGQEMFQDHLTDTLDEAVKNLTNDFQGELKAWERVHEGALMMSDFVSNGVIKQFPGSFGPRAFVIQRQQ
jgi:hypothetical protein